jgi:acetoin:2,6-dichlorophenolindophenol oxidoreductase subunit alpha
MGETDTLKTLGAGTVLGMYRRMLTIRGLENTLRDLFLEGKMPGTIHQYIGMEACAVGVCTALMDGDIIASTHRPNGHAVAMGLSLESIMAELYGKKTGCCMGKGGAMHLCDLSHGMLPANAIVGANIPIIAGVALAFKIRNEKRVAISFFGDGASNEGAFHEGINLAAVLNVPVVFVCENNQYAASTSIRQTMKPATIAERSAAYGIPGEVVDGMKVLEVYKRAKAAIEKARDGGGPTLLELRTFRYCGHSRSDPNTYMSAEEKDYWKAKDSIIQFRNLLISEGCMDESGAKRISDEVDSELARAVAFGQAADDPDPSELYKNLYVTMEVPR